jgi:acyl-CoA synthetase (AMP-forming)/AMP-acid ligase II
MGSPSPASGLLRVTLVLTYPPTHLEPTDPPRIVANKKPRSVDIVSDLPKNFPDKILKRELRERYWQGLERRM